MYFGRASLCKAANPKSQKLFSFNTELYDLRIIICLRKSEVSVERILVFNVIENLMEHGEHYLPCSYTIYVINMFTAITIR